MSFKICVLVKVSQISIHAKRLGPIHDCPNTVLMFALHRRRWAYIKTGLASVGVKRY